MMRQFRSNPKIYFSINALGNTGGQGEFLRQMKLALGDLPGCGVLDRAAIPFTQFPYRLAHDLLRSIPLLRGNQDLITLLSDLEFDAKMREHLHSPDLLDAVTGQCAGTFDSLKNSKTKRVLTCLNTHTDYLWETLRAEQKKMGPGARHFLHPVGRERARKEIHLADFIRVNSHWSKQTFVDHGVPAQKIHVIHPGVSTRHFYPTEQQDRGSVFRVLCVSSIDIRKGVFYLLKAFEEARIPRSELVLIGGTGDSWGKKMLAGFLRRNSNIFLKACDVMEAPCAQTYGTASVFVHPALEDGYGLVIPQALACGRPVIATRQSGASELIQEGKTGFVIERGSVDEIKERLLLLSADTSLRDQMSRSAPKSVSYLTEEFFALEVKKFYEAILGYKNLNKENSSCS